MMPREPSMSSDPILARLPSNEMSHLAFVAPPRGFYVRIAKPVIDRTAGAVALVLALPLLGVVAVAVRLRIGTPVLFRQRLWELSREPGVVLKVLPMRTVHPPQHDPVTDALLSAHTRRPTRPPTSTCHQSHLCRGVRTAGYGVLLRCRSLSLWWWGVVALFTRRVRCRVR